MSFDNFETPSGHAELEGLQHRVHHRTAPVPLELGVFEAVLPLSHAETADYGGLTLVHSQEDQTGAAYPDMGSTSLTLIRDRIDELFAEEQTSVDAYQKRYDPESGDLEVHVSSRVTLEDIRGVTPEEYFQRLMERREDVKDKKILRINATSAGGGVAIMNTPGKHLNRNLLGLDYSWKALKMNKDAAKVTKWKFHNVLQDVAPEGTVLTEADKSEYERMIKENAELLREPMGQADVIILDDWQPSGLIPYIKGFWEDTPDGRVYHEGINPDALILFRDHIHTEGELMVTQGTSQYTTWQYLWEHNRIKDADVFITHPKNEFVPPNVPAEKVVFMPATADLLDDLNRDLTEEERVRGFNFINQQLEINEGQTPLDLNRPYIVLIARFDESKGMPQGIESYIKAREELLHRGVSEDELPQLVVLGNGSVDDPSGEIVLEDIMDLRAVAGSLDTKRYGNVMDDLKVVLVPHNDVAINALLGQAKIALQPSIKEGFEDRVTSAMLHNVPVIGSDRGGIPLQIVHGESGFVANPLDTDLWANYIADMTTNTQLYAYMKERTAELIKTKNYQFTTVPNSIRWFTLIKILSKDRENFQGNKRWVEELAA